MCALPEAAPAPDPEAANAYLEVGDAELSAGSPATALIAYREALRQRPGDARTLSAYLAACVQASPEAALGLGREKMEAGDREAAIELFERLRQGRTDRAAALLEGICQFERGDDEAARPLLLEARAAPELAARASYFLGLVGLRNGLAAEAATDFELAAAGPGSLAERAAVLRTAALRSGRGVITFAVESGYDSNVNYAPDGQPASADGGGAISLGFALRPFGLSGPYLRANGYYRAQLQARDRNYGDFGGQLGYRLGRTETYAFADYGFDASLLGGAPYQIAHALRAGGRWHHDRLALSLVYGAFFGTYQAPAANFSGTLQTVDPEVTYSFHLGSSVYLGYHGGRDAAAKGFTNSWEHGPRAGVRFFLLPTLRVTGSASLLWRSFDEVDPAAPPGTGPRADRVLFVGGGLEQDFLDRFLVRLSLGDRVASSSDPAFSYSRLTALLALSYTAGLF